MKNKINLMYVDSNICKEMVEEISHKYFIHVQNTISINDVNSLEKRDIKLLIIHVDFLKNNNILKLLSNINVSLIVFLDMENIKELHHLRLKNLLDFFIKPFNVSLISQKINLFFHNYFHIYGSEKNKHLNNLKKYILQTLLYKNEKFYQFLGMDSLSNDFLKKNYMSLQFYTFLLSLIEDTFYKDSFAYMLVSTTKIIQEKFLYLHANVSWKIIHNELHIKMENNFKNCLLFIILISEILSEFLEGYSLEISIKIQNQQYICNIIGQHDILQYFLNKYNNFHRNNNDHFKNLLHIYLQKNFTNPIHLIPKSDKISVIEIFL